MFVVPELERYRVNDGLWLEMLSDPVDFNVTRMYSYCVVFTAKVVRCIVFCMSAN